MLKNFTSSCRINFGTTLQTLIRFKFALGCILNWFLLEETDIAPVSYVAFAGWREDAINSLLTVFVG